MKKHRHNKHNTVRTYQVPGTNTEVRGEGDDAFRRALKLFSRKVNDAGILAEVRKREHFEKPSQKRKRLRDQARRRLLKEQQKTLIRQHHKSH